MTREETHAFAARWAEAWNRRELAVIYVSEIDGRARRVSENLRFDAEGQVVAAEAFHGVAVVGSGDV